MLSNVLTLGDKIDIKPLDRNEKPIHISKTLVSQLVDFVDSNVIKIAAPIFYGKTILLNIGYYYNLCFYTNKGLYQCNCIVVSNHKDNNTNISIVKLTTNLEKYQRRQYYRLECIHDMEYHLITKEEEMLSRKLANDSFSNNEERLEARKNLTKMEQLWIRGSITDLSGGGARFNSTASLNQGDKIKIKLELVLSTQIKKLVLGSDVITSSKITNRIGAYEHRVEFNDILQRDREDLIKYIFEQERKRRKNDKN